MAEQSIVVTVDPGPEADAAELETHALNLRRELLRLDVDDVARVPAGEAPEDAKGLELVVVGSLLVKLAPHVIGKVGDVLQAWLKRGEGRTLQVRIGDREIVLSDPTDEEKRKLVDAFVASAGGGQECGASRVRNHRPRSARAGSGIPSSSLTTVNGSGNA